MDRGIAKLSKRKTEPYFNGDHLTTLGNRYVAWIDLMGVRDALEKDYKSPAIWRGELLTVVHRHINKDEAEVFSVGDGVVIMTEDESYRDSFLEALFDYYVDFNIRKYGNWKIYLHRLIRAGTGSGRVFQIDVEAHDEADNEGTPFTDNFPNEPFGPGIIEAFKTEGGAPFTIQKPSSGDDVEPHKWWENTWKFDFTVESNKKSTLNLLSDYFEYYDERDEYAYDPYNKKRKHDKAVLEFFEGHGLGIDLGPNC